MDRQFMALSLPEQNFSCDEAMIKYFGKRGLKQAIRNKSIRLGLNVWYLCTVSGCVVVFDLYQGKNDWGSAKRRILPLWELLGPPSWTS
jgi:hypothetical protein